MLPSRLHILVVRFSRAGDKLKIMVDDDTDLWIGTIDEPAITTEAPSFEELRAKVMTMISDLTDLLESEVSVVIDPSGYLADVLKRLKASQ